MKATYGVDITNDDVPQMDNVYCTCEFNRLRYNRSFRCATQINSTAYQFQAVSIDIVVKEFHHISVGEPRRDRGLDSCLPVCDLGNERRVDSWPQICSSALQEDLGGDVSKPNQPSSCSARLRHR